MRSSQDLIEKIKMLVESDGTTFLSSKVEHFINEVYTKERERLVYDVIMKVEELNFHNQTTVFNLEKLWNILHKQYIIRKGRPMKVSPIDTNVLDALKHSVNEIVEGEKQRCPGIFAFGEPAPTPEFMIGGYKIPDNITFEGVRRGRKPDSLKYYSFINAYYASKLDPMGPIESNINVVESDASNQTVQVTSSVNSVIDDTDLIPYESVDIVKVDSIPIESINSDVVYTGSTPIESANIVNNAGSAQNVPVNIVIDKADSSDQKAHVASPAKFLNVSDVIVYHPSVNVIKKYAGGTILNNDTYCRLGYHIDVLKQKEDKKVTVVKGASKSSKVPAPFVPQIYRPVEHPPNPKHNPNYGHRKYFMDPKCITYKPVVKPIEKPKCDTFFTVPAHILRSFPPSIPVPKKGRPMGSTNKTAEEKAEIEANKNPQGRPKGSCNIGPTHKSNEEAILKDNEILLRINPNLFEVHMLKYTVDNPDISYAQWINHASSVLNELYDENKSLSKMHIENWEKVTLEGIRDVWRGCLNKRIGEMSDRERRREELRERMLNVNSSYIFKVEKSDKVDKAEEVSTVASLKDGKYINVESDNVKSAVDEMHSLLRCFKDDKYIGDILRNALKQLNSLDESKLESESELEWDVHHVDDLSQDESDNISNIMVDINESDNSSCDVSVKEVEEICEFKEVGNIMDEDVICSAPCLIDIINNSADFNDKYIGDDSSSDTNVSSDDSLMQHLDMSSDSSFSWGCNVDNDNDVILSIIDDYISDGESSGNIDVVNILSGGIHLNVYENVINLMEKPDEVNVEETGVDVNNVYIFDELVSDNIPVGNVNDDVHNDNQDDTDDHIFDEIFDMFIDGMYNNLHNELAAHVDNIDMYDNSDDSVNNVNQENVVENINNVDSLILNIHQELFVNHNEMFTYSENNTRVRIDRIRNSRDDYFYGSMNKKRSRKQKKVKTNLPLW
mgnify:CR=1 FL=1